VATDKTRNEARESSERVRQTSDERSDEGVDVQR